MKNSCPYQSTRNLAGYRRKRCVLISGRVGDGLVELNPHIVHTKTIPYSHGPRRRERRQDYIFLILIPV
ncbi:MAG: hypothetical protein MUO76_22810 [Anaerolineaceae bacterium]|nr:hypothetical protein [Anaerolineaceae bacterium]